MKKHTLAVAAIAILFIGMGVYFGANRYSPGAPATNSADFLYGKTLTDASGNPQSIAQWKGKNLIVNFWATWCPPCIDEMPELSALQNSIKSSNTQILGIGIDTAPNIRQFSEKHRITYPLYVSGVEGTELSRQFGNRSGGLPFTVLIDANGHIKKSYLGRLNMDELRKDIAGL